MLMPSRRPCPEFMSFHNYYYLDGDDYTTHPPPDTPPTTQAPTDFAMTQAPTDALVMTATFKTVIPTRLPVRKKKPIKKVKVRKDFPETWLWTDVKLK